MNILLMNWVSWDTQYVMGGGRDVYTSLVGVPTKSTKIEPLQIPVIPHTVSKHVLYNVETFHKEEEEKKTPNNIKDVYTSLITYNM